MIRRSIHACIALIMAISLVTLSAPSPATAQDLELDPDFAADPIPDIWEEADGADARSETGRSWIWGPAILSATHEPYIDSPDGNRQVYYFDKARMEINDPDASRDSDWYATSGLLIREMMMGQIQIGDESYIETAPAEIPVTGDLTDNPNSPTYATFGTLTVFEDQDENRAEDRVGEPATAFLHADGSTDTLSSPPAESEIAYYDETLGFNVPDVFWDWMNDQTFDWRYVIGHPVTEAYWVDTMIDGEETVVMVQAFERRVLTFNAENDPDWQVEAGNAGLHYRAWRDLSMPEDPRLHALAYSIPYGEIIAEAAESTGVDAFMLAGVAQAASGFNPQAELIDDRVGLMGVPLLMLEQRGIQYPLDPTFNVWVAADLLAMLNNQNGSSEQAALEYFEWQDAVGSFTVPPAETIDEAIAAWQEFEATYSGEPSPFGIEFDDPEPTPEPEPPAPSPPDNAGSGPEPPDQPGPDDPVSDQDPPDQSSDDDADADSDPPAQASDDDDIPELLEHYAEEYDLDPNLVKAVAWLESSWDQSSISSSGAIGVMQIMPGTAIWINDNLVERELDVRENVQDNIEAGAAYLAHRIEQFGNVEEGLAAYNVGPVAVQNNGVSGAGAEYVERVLDIYEYIEENGEPPGWR